MPFSRRGFLATAALGGASLVMNPENAEADSQSGPAARNERKHPIVICSLNGFNYIDAGFQKLSAGADTLDAAIEVAQGPENDPKDDSVGLGGLPNEDGVVELDASCMHGPTRRAGAVAGVHDIKNVARLAKTVMERTGHVMLVGDGATRFGLEHGFPKENLLTEESRKKWMLWKETMSDRDFRGPGLSSPEFIVPQEGGKSSVDERREHMERIAAELGIPAEERLTAIHDVLFPHSGTINCSALNEKGEMSTVTTTSGLAWKIPGRAGDSPIIGAGCFCDQDVGAAGATGNGEENIRICGAQTIVENMRKGMEPAEAGLDALKRIARNYNGDMKKLRYIEMTYYVLRKDGAYSSVTLWSKTQKQNERLFAVHDGAKRKEKCVALFEGVPLGFPPLT